MSTEASDRALGASYELVEPIGRGGTGEVWLTRVRRTGETVAAKLLHREHLDDDALVARFVRERSILIGLRHPNVVGVRDLVVERERLSIVMDLVDGGSLRDVLDDRGPLPPALALRVAAAVLDGLAAAHDRGVRHGDVKPDNVLLAVGWQDLGPGAVRLSDFGVAEILIEAPGGSGLVGTPEYLAPEQVVRGSGGSAADVYGAGILLYELLAGRTPFGGGADAYAVARRHVTGEPPRLRVPGPVWDALASLLARDPDGRATASAAATWLRRLAPTVDDLAALPGTGPTRTSDEAVPVGRPRPSPTSPPDLGVPDRATLVRPIIPPPTSVTARADPPPDPSPAARRGRRR